MILTKDHYIDGKIIKEGTMLKIKEKSKEKIIFNTKFFKVKETEKGFYFGERLGINSISVLPYFYDQEGNLKIVIRLQPMPLDNSEDALVYPSTVTGSFKEGENFSTIKNSLVIEELTEEVGLKETDIINIQELTPSIATTQMNELVYNFLVEINGDCVKSNGEGDGSVFEEMSENVIIDLESLYNYISEGKPLSLLFIDKTDKGVGDYPLSGLSLAVGVLFKKLLA